MWLSDLESLDIIKVNKAALSLYGYSKDEMLKLSSKDLFANEEIPRLEDYLLENNGHTGHAKVIGHATKEGTLIQVKQYTHLVRVDRKLC